jgi:hypothetical protein
MRTPSTTSYKRKAEEMDDEEDFIRKVPTGRRAKRKVEPRIITVPYFRSQLANNTPDIFVPNRSIRVDHKDLDTMYDMLKRDSFAVDRICADLDGCFWIFDDSGLGDRGAAAYYKHFQGVLFNGVPMDAA